MTRIILALVVLAIWTGMDQAHAASLKPRMYQISSK